MSRLSFYLPPFSSDYAGVASALFDLDALVVLHDPMLALNYCDELLLLKDGRNIGIIRPGTDPADEMAEMLSGIYGRVSVVTCADRSGGKHVVMLKENKNYPFEFIVPESGTPVLTEGIAIVKDAKHPKAAEAFYEFVNTEEAAKILAEEFYRIPTRNDVKDLPAWITETEIKAMDIDWKVFQEQSDDWMKYWDENIKSGEKEIKE